MNHILFSIPDLVLIKIKIMNKDIKKNNNFNIKVIILKIILLVLRHIITIWLIEFNEDRYLFNKKFRISE